MKNKLSDIEGRVKRHWYTDGLAELSTGGMFILLGLYFGLQEALGERSSVSVLRQVGLVLLMIAGAVSVSWLVNTLKTRITYPRTGYVEYNLNEQDDPRRRYLVMTVAAIMAIASITLIRYIRGFDSIVLGIAVVAGVVFITLHGRSPDAKRFYILGMFSIVLGIGLSLGGLSHEFRLALFFGLMGIAIIISGGLDLRRYLQENSIPPEIPNER